MSNHSLFDYYENELSFVRKNLQAFARQHPRHAKGLGIHRDHIEDPDVLRLVESFSLLTARLHQRLDHDLDGLSGDLLEALCPELIAPMPSATVLGFSPDPECLERTFIPAGTTVECHDDSTLIPRLTTRTAVELWPITISRISLTKPPYSHASHFLRASEARLELTIKPCSAEKRLFELEGLDHLDFYIDLDSQHSGALFEYVHTRCIEVMAVGENVQTLGAKAITKLGLDAHHHKSQQRSPQSLSLIRDYVVFPQRFLSFRINSLASCMTHAQDYLHIHLYFDRFQDRLAKAIDDTSLKLFAAPAYNLFAKAFEPIEMRDEELCYEIIADNGEKRFTEAHTVDSVTILNGDGTEQQAVQLYDPDRLLARSATTASYWLRRQVNPDSEQAGSIALTFSGQDDQSDSERVLICRGLAHNRDYFNRLSYYDYASLHFQLEEPIPTVTKVEALGEFTKYVAAKADYKWLLLSQLRPRSMSGTSGMQYIIDLFTLFGQGQALDYSALVAIEAQATRKKALVDGMPVLVFGTVVELTVDPSKPLGINLYLLCEIIWRMLEENAPANSFTEFRVMDGSGAEPLYAWESDL